MNKPKITIVVGVLNQFDLTKQTIIHLSRNANNPKDIELLVVDNGSSKPFLEFMFEDNDMKEAFDSFNESSQVIRNDKNIGNYPIFKQAVEVANAPITAFLHSDLIVYEKGWDERVINLFETQPEYGLIGFIGSTELDNFGGRGSGTCSNFMDKGVQIGDKAWTGSAAEVHGRRETQFTGNAAVVDGCSMIFKTDVLKSIDVLEGFPLHHFYDRLMACQVIEKGFKVGVLGIECDHISGQVANQESHYFDTAKEWAKNNLGIDELGQWVELNRAWWENTMNPSRGNTPNNWDHLLYLEAEKQFLKLYRDTKRFVPIFNGKPNS